MWTKSFNIEVIVICFLSLIPWPGPSVFKRSCSRDNARVVRKIVQSKWMPILDKYHVKLPLECPFHPNRDIFGPQQLAKKQNRPSQWTCGFCGKSFFEEKQLDSHFDNRHRSNINMGEDAICLADYCDLMRCEVIVTHDATLSFGDTSTINTDIELWSEANSYRTALTTVSRHRELVKFPNSKKPFPPSTVAAQTRPLVSDKLKVLKKIPHTATECENGCDSVRTKESSKRKTAESAKLPSKSNLSESDDEDANDNNTASDKNLVDSVLPPVDKKQMKIAEMQRMKANCKNEDLDKLKTKCELLIRDCVAGLLVQLSIDDFKTMEEELNRSVCWYLTCERYWEDGLPDRPFPWGLVFVLVMVLSLGVCLCYYIIWVIFDTDDQTNYPSPTSFNSLIAMHSSPTHHLHQFGPQMSQSIYHSQSTGPQQSNMATTTIGGGGGSVDVIAHHPSMANVNISHVDHQMPISTLPPPHGYTEEFFTPNAELNELGQSEHYIYVTYPPELKKRLLESCYNRTTRL